MPPILFTFIIGKQLCMIIRIILSREVLKPSITCHAVNIVSTEELCVNVCIICESNHTVMILFHEHCTSEVRCTVYFQ